MSSRTGRVDVRHQILDPLIVAGPTLLRVLGTVAIVRRTVRLVRRIPH
jgi:hypothetical protein